MSIQEIFLKHQFVVAICGHHCITCKRWQQEGGEVLWLCNPRGPEEKRPWRRRRTRCRMWRHFRLQKTVEENSRRGCVDKWNTPACIEREKRYRRLSFLVIRFLEGGGRGEIVEVLCSYADRPMHDLKYWCKSATLPFWHDQNFLRGKKDFLCRSELIDCFIGPRDSGQKQILLSRAWCQFVLLQPHGGWDSASMDTRLSMQSPSQSRSFLGQNLHQSSQHFMTINITWKRNLHPNSPGPDLVIIYCSMKAARMQCLPLFLGSNVSLRDSASSPVLPPTRLNWFFCGSARRSFVTGMSHFFAASACLSFARSLCLLWEY